MPRFVYRKDNGEESVRTVIPVGYKFGDRDKILCIDVSDASVDDIRHLDELHQEYLEKIKDAGFYNKFRLFFVDGIEEVISE